MITALTGENDYAVNKVVDDKQRHFIDQYGDFAVERLDCEEAEASKITEAIQSLPFLVSNKLVILRQPSKNKNFTDVFPELTDTIPDNIEVLIVEPKPDKRSSYYKTLKSKSDYKEFQKLDNVGLARWLAEEVKLSGGSIASADARLLVDRVGNNQLRLSSELSKLMTYSPHITKDTIVMLTTKSPQSTVFELVDAAMSGNHGQAIRLYEEQRVQKVEPQQIIGMLAWQLQILALIKTSNGKSSAQIASDSRNNPYVISKSMKLAQNITYKQVETNIQKLLEIDIALKTTNVDPDLMVQGFIMSL